MKLLEDILICEARVYLKTRVGKKAETQSEKAGKKADKEKAKILRKLESALRQEGFTVLESGIDSYETHLTYAPKNLEGDVKIRAIELVGVPDIVALLERNGGFMVLNLEVADYSSAPAFMLYRQAGYSLSLYSMFGFPVVPAVLTTNNCKVYVLRNEEFANTGLAMLMKRILELWNGAEPRPPQAKEFCTTCEPQIRANCQYLR